MRFIDDKTGEVLGSYHPENEIDKRLIRLWFKNKSSIKIVCSEEEKQMLNTFHCYDGKYKGHEVVVDDSLN